MRADRLLSLLMLLQARGRMTAQELAAELEVSERTIYRDINALSASGVPVYAESGPGGGCALLDSYRTNLTGLTADEARALFMLNIPAALDQLGVTQELKAALLKLSAALPEARRRDEERIRQRIHLDSTWWFQAEEPLPHLQTHLSGDVGRSAGAGHAALEVRIAAGDAGRSLDRAVWVGRQGGRVAHVVRATRGQTINCACIAWPM